MSLCVVFMGLLVVDEGNRERGERVVTKKGLVRDFITKLKG